MYAPWQLPLLFGTGVAAGFVDSIAGGGGLITLPVLLSFGGDTATEFGTGKVQAVCGSGSAAWHYTRAKAVDFRDCTRLFIINVISSALGGIVLQMLAMRRPEALRKAIPIVLIVLAVYMLLRPQLGFEDRQPRMRRVRFDLLFGSLIGFYDGLFGPGTGTFWAVAFVLCLGFNLTKATAYTKVANFGSNVGALGAFLWQGHADFVAGASMGAGQLLGARIGSGMVIKRGVKFIRPVFITVVIAVTLKLLYDAYRT